MAQNTNITNPADLEAVRALADAIRSTAQAAIDYRDEQDRPLARHMNEGVSDLLDALWLTESGVRCSEDPTSTIALAERVLGRPAVRVALQQVLGVSGAIDRADQFTSLAFHARRALVA